MKKEIAQWMTSEEYRLYIKETLINLARLTEEERKEKLPDGRVIRFT